jgi:hypothetical protein
MAAMKVASSEILKVETKVVLKAVTKEHPMVESRVVTSVDKLDDWKVEKMAGYWVE